MKVFLIPTFLGEHGTDFFSQFQLKTLEEISVFVAENLRTARRHLRKMGFSRSFDDIQMFEMGKRADKSLFSQILCDCQSADLDIALISEAGVPAVADPGADFVALAHEKGIDVLPIPGPSSILLSLCASGLNGQNFAFCGYLPIGKSERKAKIAFLEKESATCGRTEIFIETPFRADSMLCELLSTLKAATRLCVARDILGENQLIRTKTVAGWRKNPPQIGKIPTVFLFAAKSQ